MTEGADSQTPIATSGPGGSSRTRLLRGGAERVLTSSPPRRDRRRAGKKLREKVPRSSHAAWTPSTERVDPIETLRESNAGRIPRLVPIRYGRMAHSPLAFLRGAAAVMARDLATTPVTGPRVQLCGDAHLANFGAFASPERDQVFDVNDFDETLPGPWEWDVKRLATSLVLAGRATRLPTEECGRLARRAVRAYREQLRELSGLPYAAIWYSHLDLENLPDVLVPQARHELKQVLRRARHKTNFDAFPKLTRRVDGGYRIREEPPLLVHHRKRADHEVSLEFLEQYLRSLPEERRMLIERYHVVDVVEKVVGVGSVGTMCEAVLLLGDEDVEDPLFLQLKEADRSVLEPYAGASDFANHAQRVVAGQHLIQEASDIFLGWSSLRGRDFYVRQLRDMKGAAELEHLGARGLFGHGELCGAALARAHARTGDPAMISGYLGDGRAFDRAVAGFAGAYADQTERDHAELLRAIRRGRVHAEVVE